MISKDGVRRRKSQTKIAWVAIRWRRDVKSADGGRRAICLS